MNMSIIPFGYVRVSGVGQADKDGPVRQEVAIRDFTTKNQFSPVRIFKDLGVSGTIEGMNRPGFIRMLTEAATEGATCIVVENLERLARDLMVSELLIRELRNRNLSLYAVNQGLMDLTQTDNDPTRKMIRQMFSAMAEFEKSTIVLKLRAARERMRKEGNRVEGRKPYGKNFDERKVLQVILNLRSSGVSWEAVSDMLTKGGLRKRNGKRTWTKQEVWKIYQTFLRDRRQKAVKKGLLTKTQPTTGFENLHVL